MERLECYLKKSSVKIIPYEEKYRDDMIFCFLSAKDALRKLPNSRPLTFKTELLDIPTKELLGCFRYDFSIPAGSVVYG
ncbi:hypothetical protein FACS1894105_08200 [Clostridia bacterium]|nr:hypothetical protein FACS1894105_08200 [Clostridia bacterium]